MDPRPRLSVVVPAYDEEARIGASLERLAAWLPGLPGTSEVIVVDDGSRDGTAAVVERFAARPISGGLTVRLLRNGRNRGKGYSIKHGVLLARGLLVLVSDADFSTPIEELPPLLRAVEEDGRDLVIGSRGLGDSRVELRQPFWRQTMGKTFNLLVRALTGLPYRDTQCGFKLMRRDAVLPLFRAARIERFAYDVEILYLARRAGLSIAEVPVLWRDARGSKVSPLSDALDMLKDVVRVVRRDRRGGYGRAVPPAAREGGR